MARLRWHCGKRDYRLIVCGPVLVSLLIRPIFSGSPKRTLWRPQSLIVTHYRRIYPSAIISSSSIKCKCHPCLDLWISYKRVRASEQSKTEQNLTRLARERNTEHCLVCCPLWQCLTPVYRCWGVTDDLFIVCLPSLPLLCIFCFIFRWALSNWLDLFYALDPTLSNTWRDISRQH